MNVVLDEGEDCLQICFNSIVCDVYSKQCFYHNQGQTLFKILMFSFLFSFLTSDIYFDVIIPFGLAAIGILICFCICVARCLKDRSETGTRTISGGSADMITQEYFTAQPPEYNEALQSRPTAQTVVTTPHRVMTPQCLDYLHWHFPMGARLHHPAERFLLRDRIKTPSETHRRAIFWKDMSTEGLETCRKYVLLHCWFIRFVAGKKSRALQHECSFSCAKSNELTEQDMFCFKHASAFYTNNTIVKNIYE